MQIYFKNNASFNAIDTFYDVVFTAKTLCDLRIQKCNKTERSKRFRYKHVGNFAKFTEIILKILCSNVLRTSAHKNLARGLPSVTILSKKLLILNNTKKLFTLRHHLWTRNPDVAPTTVNHMSLSKNTCLRIIRCESYKTKTLRLTCFNILFYLEGSKHKISSKHIRNLNEIRFR